VNETDDENTLVGYFKNRMGRRAFARTTLFGSVGLTAFGAMTGDVKADANSDIAILQFALNLEYLEAEFYTVVTTGRTIAQLGIGTNGVGTEGPTVGGGKVPLSAPVMNLAIELAADEQAHVKLLRSALGADAIAKPTIDFSVGAVSDETSFLLASRLFEDVGVSAYAGAAPYLSNKDTLSIAARILGTEAEHTGTIRFFITQYTAIRPTAADRKDVVNRIISAESSAGLTSARTPGEVLAIAFMNPGTGVNRGGFFRRRQRQLEPGIKAFALPAANRL
jgi:hypothetical protein